jgi:hypothetical protein
MHYSSNCGCGCNYDCGCNTVPSTCSSTTNNIVTTTTHCVGEPCDELYNADCVLYKGPNIPCYGLNVNDTLTDIIDSIVSNFTGCITTDVCFTIITDGIRTVQSCLIKASTDYWNGKQYYKIKYNSCSDLIGYVYWNSTDKQWEYSPYLGGGSVITSILPIQSASPLSSTQWINASPATGIISSISGFCTPTTTTSTSTTTTSTTTSTTTTSTTTSTTTTSTTTTRPPTTTSTTTTPPPTTTTTTGIPVGFTATFGSCYLDTGTGSILITNCTGGTGTYQRSTTTFSNLSDALNNTSFVDISNPTTGYTYPFEPSGTRYIVVRDKNNPVNKLIKTTTGYCCWRNAKVYTSSVGTFEYLWCDGTKQIVNFISGSAYLLQCSVKQSIIITSGIASIDLNSVINCS